MIDTLSLLPPDHGPRSNPVLFGIAEGIAEMFPPVVLAPRPREETPANIDAAEGTELSVEAAAV